MIDLINRQETIDTIKNADVCITWNGEISAEDAADIAVRATKHSIIDSVEDLPPEQQWILCSEQLPHMYGWYLCTLKDGRVNAYYWNNNGVWLDNAKKHLFDLYEIRSRYTGMEIKPENEAVYWTELVVAWMPLPEPYQEGERNDI